MASMKHTHPGIIIGLVCILALALNAYIFGVYVMPSLARSQYPRTDQLPCSVFVKPAPKGCHR